MEHVPSVSLLQQSILKNKIVHSVMGWHRHFPTVMFKMVINMCVQVEIKKYLDQFYCWEAMMRSRVAAANHWNMCL